MDNELVKSANDQVEEIARLVIEEKDYEREKDLINLFNAAQAKKNVIRSLKLNGLLDHVSDAMIERFEKNYGEFSNKDLIDYMNVVHSTLDKTTKALMDAEQVPVIQLNQTNQVNISLEDGSELSKESRDKVADFIKAVLKNNNAMPIEEDLVVVEENTNE